MSRPGFFTHPKPNRAADDLGIPLAHLIGLCECLWAVGYESGNPSVGDSRAVEIAAKWTGERGALTKALAECGGPGRAGLIELGEDGRYEIHDFFVHAPEYVIKRAQREAARAQVGETISDVRRRAAKARWGKKPDDANGVHADANGGRLQDNGGQRPANGAPPSPSPLNTNTPLPPRGGAEGSTRKPRGRKAPLVETPGFVRFWDAWPANCRKEDRAKCAAKWGTMDLEALTPTILTKLARWRVSQQWSKDDGQFIPAPLPWLNKRKWELPDPPRASAATHAPKLTAEVTYQEA